MNGRALADQTRARLNLHKGKFRRIASEFGISYHYLTKFAQGQRDNPTVDTIDRLNQALDEFERGKQAA